jgi:hypothetical protein
VAVEYWSERSTGLSMMSGCALFTTHSHRELDGRRGRIFAKIRAHAIQRVICTWANRC